MPKRCTKCGIKKPLSEFCKHKITKDGLRYDCKECNKKHSQSEKGKQILKKYHRTHKIKIREYNKKYRQTETGKLKYEGPERDLKGRYGMTLEQYDKMFINQNGVCVICGGINKNGRRLSVDHDHETGKIRALLCQNCNVLLGNAKENITILQSAINYLKNYKT